jgi:F420-dependent oxidoreductase-like protein
MLKEGRPTLKLAMNIAPSPDIPTLRRRVRALESAGLDVMVVSEGYSVDAPSLLGFLAAVTERVQLLAGVLSIFSRSPTLLATTAAGLDQLSGGRAALGLGASGPQVVEGWHGRRFDHPLARTRETVAICREVWQGNRVDHDGPVLSVPLSAERGGSGLGKPLRMVGRPLRPDIPVYLAALGPKNVELTAEIADGWLPTLFDPERAGPVFAAALASGGERRAADRGPLELMVSAPVAFGSADQVGPARQRSREKIAMFAGGMGSADHNFYNQLIVRYGFIDAAMRIQELFLAGDRAAAAAAVPDALVLGLSVCGDEGYVKDRVDVYRAAGVTCLKIESDEEHAVEVVDRLRRLLD